MQINAIHTERYLSGDLAEWILAQGYRPREEGEILAVTSKIVALSQGRVAPASAPKRALVEREADRVLGEFDGLAGPTLLTLKDGLVTVTAGIDESNAWGGYVLLPSRPFEVAKKIWAAICEKTGFQHLGVILTDSRTSPCRKGVVGVALGYWGFQGLADHRGLPDLDGRPIGYSQSNVADALAAAAVLVMGEAAERRPLAVIRGFDAHFCAEVDTQELLVAPAEDLYFNATCIKK